MTDRGLVGKQALPEGAEQWLWPVGAGVLSAWPIWRSVAPEVPDLGDGWFRLGLVCGLLLATLYGVWAWSKWRLIYGLVFPFWAIALAFAGAVAATMQGDQDGADLCVLMIAWTAVVGTFASLAMLKMEAAGRIAGCAAAHRCDLFPPVPFLGHIYGVAMLGITYLWTVSHISVVIMGVISPGAILAWASLSDTARSVLSGRRVHFSNAAVLAALARMRRWRLMSPAVLVSDRPKLVGLYPAEGVRPGDLAALAAALTMDDESDLGRATQEFGVSHRIRMPALKQVQGVPASAGRKATLLDGTRVELHDPAAFTAGEFDLVQFAEAMALAHTLHRSVLVVVERRPQPRVLGLVVFAMAARPGAAEALQDLRRRGIDVALTVLPRDARDELVLKSLQVAPNVAAGGDGGDSVNVVRPTHAGIEAKGLVLQFGAARAHIDPPVANIVVAREDARTLCDVARFVADFRARTTIATLLSNAPGWVLIAAAFGYLPASPLLVTGVALVGIALAVAGPQVLHLSATLAKEVDEE